MTDSTLAFSQDLAFALFNSNEEYPVDFDLAWQWLGYSTKGHAKRFLTNSRFKEGRDFLPLMVKTPEGGRPSELIMLTVDCFKCWGMKTETEQGDLIREYFLECEKIAKEKRASLTMGEQLLANAQAVLALEAKQREQDLINRQQESINIIAQTERNLLGIQIDDIEAEVHRYRNGMGDYYTILAWSKILGIKNMTLGKSSNLGRKAARLCKLNGITPEPTYDVRFGEVGSYPKFILEQVNFQAAA